MPSGSRAALVAVKTRFRGLSKHGTEVCLERTHILADLCTSLCRTYNILSFLSNHFLNPMYVEKKPESGNATNLMKDNFNSSGFMETYSNHDKILRAGCSEI